MTKAQVGVITSVQRRRALVAPEVPKLLKTHQRAPATIMRPGKRRPRNGWRERASHSKTRMSPGQQPRSLPHCEFCNRCGISWIHVGGQLVQLQNVSRTINGLEENALIYR